LRRANSTISPYSSVGILLNAGLPFKAKNYR
jgi:hypothetical protein